MFFRVGIDRVPHFNTEHRSGKRYQSGLSIKSKLQGCKITVTDDDFWSSADGRVVDQLKNPRGSVSASDSNYGLHRSIAQHLVEVFRPMFIGPGQIPMLVHDVAADLYAITESLEVPDTFVDFLLRGGRAGGGKDADTITSA